MFRHQYRRFSGMAIFTFISEEKAIILKALRRSED